LPEEERKTRDTKQKRGTQTFQVDSPEFIGHPYNQAVELNSLKAVHDELEEAYNQTNNSRDKASKKC
jgi:hypothetical protein